MKVRHLETSCSLEPQDRVPTRPVSKILGRCFPQFPVTPASSFSLLSSPCPSPPLATSASTPWYFPLRSWGEVPAGSPLKSYNPPPQIPPALVSSSVPGMGKPWAYRGLWSQVCPSGDSLRLVRQQPPGPHIPVAPPGAWTLDGYK